MDAYRADWNYPSQVRVGAGRVRELASVCRELGMHAPLLITDPGLKELDMVAEALAACRADRLTCEVFSNVRSNPNGANVAEGVAAFHRGRHDGVIALGGGSALDAAKAVALMAGQERSLWDFEDVGDQWQRVIVEGMAPVVAIPTTAGTGSEVGRAAVITDTEQRRKRIIFHPRMLPARVILDPELTLGLPSRITAATGMDALSHSLEAYCAPGYHPMADGIALEAMRLIKDYLPRAVADGTDLEARTQMLVASCMGATAFQKGLGAMHALAHSLGALYDAHHGTLNAVLMPYVLQANRAAIATRMETLARYLELPESGFDGLLNWVLALRDGINIPHRLAMLDIDDNASARVGAMAVADAAAAGNPVQFDASQYAELFSNAVHGRLAWQ